jgi:hypothetical protein
MRVRLIGVGATHVPLSKIFLIEHKLARQANARGLNLASRASCASRNKNSDAGLQRSRGYRPAREIL